MPAKDLGLVNNEIVSVQRTTGSGLPGQTDTYTITLRSGATYTFNVTNGNIGGGLHFVQTGASTFSNLTIALENAGLSFSSVIKIWATYVDAYNDRILADVVFTGPDETDGEMTPRGQVYDTSNLAFVGADEYLNGKTSAEYWIVYMAPETNPTAYVPVSRTIAGLNLESDITENALFDKMSMKGRYTTLTALQTANPNHGYCYLVEENNHWYYWNGSAWTDGGTYLAIGADYAFNKNSSNGIQNGIVADTFEKIVKSYSTLKQYLYKKDTYLNNGVETYLSGYDLLKIPLKKEHEIIKIEWDLSEPFYGVLNANSRFYIEDSNGVITALPWSTGNPNYGFKGTEGNGFIINNDVTDISYIYLSVKNDRYDKGNIYIGNEEKIQLNQKEQKTFTVVEYGKEKDFIKTTWYIKSTNAADILGSGYECVWFKMKQGDKIVLEGSVDVLSYYGVIKNQDGTLVSLGTDMEYTATNTIIVGIFLQNGASRKFTYYPVDSMKIQAGNVVGLEGSQYNGLTGVAFGTSLTYRAQTTGGYLTKLAELSGITFDNQGIGSSVILGNMLTAIKNYTGYSGKRVALLEGFVNDWYQEKTLGTYTDTTETTVCGCVRSAINYMYSQNANLTVFLILDHYGKSSGGADCSSTETKNGKTQFEYYEEIAKVAESMGVIVIKQYAMSEISERTPQYLLDNIHMNALGSIRSAYAIWSVMKQFYPNNI